ncbi:hypothetical protein DER45DRAFT_236753 [Fusarium avenaceum]|nr:hypothetical protein DER45DRAFT_236753 [Fusarium avenaceum]
MVFIWLLHQISLVILSHARSSAETTYLGRKVKCRIHQENTKRRVSTLQPCTAFFPSRVRLEYREYKLENRMATGSLQFLHLAVPQHAHREDNHH